MLAHPVGSYLYFSSEARHSQRGQAVQQGAQKLAAVVRGSLSIPTPPYWSSREAVSCTHSYCTR